MRNCTGQGIDEPEKAVNRLTTRQFQTHAYSSNNVIVWPKLPSLELELPLFPAQWNPGLPLGVYSMTNPGGGEMDDGAELATAGLVVAFAAVLLVVSHFFIEAQSTKQFAKSSIDLKVRTNVIGSWL